MTALQFSEADLHTNRLGNLSAIQADRIKRARRRQSVFAAVVFVNLVWAATLLIYAGQTHQNALMGGAGVLLVLCNAVLVGIVGRAWMRMSSDLRAGAVEALAGDVERVVRRGRTGDNYLLRIDGAGLYVSRDVFLAFQHEAPYRIYRASHSRVLLSAERIA